MDASVPSGPAPEKTLSTWLFNPFQYVAGGRALLAGLVLILSSGIIAAFGGSRFDGVLDFHPAFTAVPLWTAPVEGFIDWIAISVFLLIGGWLFSRSRIRPLDVFGTQALARAPWFIASLFALPPGFAHFSAYLMDRINRTTPAAVHVSDTDATVFVVATFVILLMVIWFVTLMYRAFSVSCNLSGGKAAAIFIVALVLAEIASKWIIFAVLGPVLG